MFKSFKKLFALCAAFVLTACTPLLTPAKISAASAPSDDFEIGVACHGSNITAYSKNLEEYIYKAAQMGVSLIRIDMGAGSPAEIAYQDKIVALCEAYGLNLMPIVYDPQTAENLGKRYGSRIKYWQMSNERDNETILTGDGTNPDHYDINLIANAIGNIKGISEQLRKYAPKSKLLVNFTWTHYAFMDFIVNEKVDFDIVGYDWYSNMETYGLERALTDIRDKYGKPILICESNIWTKDHLNNTPGQTYESYIKNDPAPKNMAPYIKECIELCLRLKDSHNILGYTVYELLNEPQKWADQPAEAVFGLISVNPDFTIGQPKVSYYELQKYFGGNSSLSKIPVSSLNLDQFGSLTNDDSGGNNNGGGVFIPEPDNNSGYTSSNPNKPYDKPAAPNKNPDDSNSISEESPSVNQAEPQVIQSVQTSHIYKEPGFPIWLIIELAVCGLAAAGGAVYIILERRKAKLTAAEAEPEIPEDKK